jgi:AcrR family transcriptional regulator
VPDQPPAAISQDRATRRTQAERREQTRAKLLDATIESVLEVGYAGTTTRRVAELAGVSQGAQTHHFPHRVDLVGAAVERLAARRVAELRALAADLPTAPSQRVAALLDLLWADFSSPIFTVFVKLWVAAADDQELYARLVPVERQLARAIAAAAEDFGGELVDRPEWTRSLMLALSAVRGLALGERFEPRGRRRRDPWPELRAALVQTFERIPANQVTARPVTQLKEI